MFKSKKFLGLALIVVAVVGIGSKFYFSPENSESSGTEAQVSSQNKQDEQTDTEKFTGKKSIAAVESFNLPFLLTKEKTDCPDSAMSCILKELGNATETYGPAAAVAMTETLQKDGSIPLSEDDHQIAHKIGRKTAEIFGINGNAFIACPTQYNYGCMHGFFEYALGRTDSPKEAAETICGSLTGKFSEKYVFSCYHGVGHGLLMARGNDVHASIDLCDTFSSDQARQGCWQGVFMENVNAGTTGQARSGTFSETDPLAPCNTFADKYQHECFINHAGWLMKFFKNDISKASAACLKAPVESGGQQACFQSVGLMVTNPSWQPALAPDATGSVQKIAWSLCRKFPTGYVRECVRGGVDNIMNFDELKTDRAEEFCSLVDAEFIQECRERIQASIRAQTPPASSSEFKPN